MTSPSLQPVNIQRLLKQNNQIAEACEYAKSICTGSIVAGWHESGPSARGAQSAAATLQQQERVLAQQGLLKERQMKLKQLLERERLDLEAELQQQGLALVKHRD